MLTDDEIKAVYARAYDDAAEKGRHLAGLRAVAATAPQGDFVLVPRVVAVEAVQWMQWCVREWDMDLPQEMVLLHAAIDADCRDIAALAAAPQPQGEPVAWRYPVYWWQPAEMQHTEWWYIHRPDEISAAAHAAEVIPQPLYAATQPSAEPTVSKDAYDGAREDLAIWTKRALAAEELNRKFAAVVNGPTFMGEPVQPSAEPTTECTTCGATVVRVTGVYDYPPPGDELVQAARDALAAMIDGLTPVENGRPHHMVMAYKRALDALRRALDKQPQGEWQPVPPRACIKPTHEAANAFWLYWRENGETHKHGFYESTWGAINAALAHGWNPPRTDAPVQAARDALAAMIDGLTPVEDGRPHHMVMEYKRALDALRRALAASDPAGKEPSDAEQWGKALNAAAWEFVDAWPDGCLIPPIVWNNLKAMLRKAILKYESMGDAPVAQAVREAAAAYVRDNYQGHTVASLCDAIRAIQIEVNDADR